MSKVHNRTKSGIGNMCIFDYRNIWQYILFLLKLFLIFFCSRNNSILCFIYNIFFLFSVNFFDEQY